MAIAASRLFKMLIDESLLEDISWTGKSAANTERHLKFKSVSNNIRKVLHEALNAMDKSYTEADLQKDITYSILKPKTGTKKKLTSTSTHKED